MKVWHFLKMTFKIVFIMGVALSVQGCRSSRPSSEVAPSFDRGALLASVGSCAVDIYARFESEMGALEKAAVVARDTPTPTNRTAVQSAFVRAFDIWQEAEVSQFGPLGPTAQSGGSGLREAFYGWPVDGRCLVDQNLASKAYVDAATFADGSLPQGRDLAALEYLLFFEGPEHACSPTSALAKSGAWATMTAADREARRADYAAKVAASLEGRAKGLVATWNNGFLATLRNAGHAGSPYPNTRVALDAVLEALFYVDYVTKDRKVGTPLGVIADSACSAGPCPDLVEARLSLSSRRSLRQNLVAFRKLWHGCDAVGFDDFLTAAGAGSLSAEVDVTTDAAIAAIDALGRPTLETALVEDRPAVTRVFEALRALSDVLKTDVASTLRLDLPARVSGDAD